jgi:hypothetical protein
VLDYRFIIPLLEEWRDTMVLYSVVVEMSNILLMVSHRFSFAKVQHVLQADGICTHLHVN